MRKLVVFLLMLAAPAVSQAPPKAAPDKPYTVDYYYKVQWGRQDEFLRLFKKNHYPILKKEMAASRVLSIGMTAPENHMPEEARWDFRVSIVYRNANVVHEPFDTEAAIRQLYPDRATFDKEEQRRFEILQAHWDLPLAPVDLEPAP
jgi:hypothetical protein